MERPIFVLPGGFDLLVEGIVDLAEMNRSLVAQMEDVGICEAEWMHPPSQDYGQA